MKKYFICFVSVLFLQSSFLCGMFQEIIGRKKKLVIRPIKGWERLNEEEDMDAFKDSINSWLTDEENINQDFIRAREQREEQFREEYPIEIGIIGGIAGCIGVSSLCWYGPWAWVLIWGSFGGFLGCTNSLIGGLALKNIYNKFIKEEE